MNRIPSSIAFMLATLLVTTQSHAAYFATLSVGGQTQTSTRWSVAAADESNELDELEALENEEKPKPPAAKKATAAPKPATATAKSASPATAPTIQRMACQKNDDCKRGFMCIDGSCYHKDEVDAGTTGMKYNLDAKQWAFAGGLVGHGLWLTGLVMSLAIDPTLGSTAGVWGIYTASTIISNIAANSAIDKVGVYGGPGQKVGSWIFFSLGVVTFLTMESIILVTDILNDAVDDDIVPITPGMVTIMTFPSMMSGALMSSVALRANRQVRRAQRGQEETKTSMNFNLLPHRTDGKPTGAIGQMTWRF